jgi:hypothetical protein
LQCWIMPIKIIETTNKYKTPKNNQVLCQALV